MLLLLLLLGRDHLCDLGASWATMGHGGHAAGTGASEAYASSGSEGHGLTMKDVGGGERYVWMDDG